MLKINDIPSYIVHALISEDELKLLALIMI